MEEIAFTMKLKPGVAAEYEHRHDEIWPELSTLLTARSGHPRLFHLPRRRQRHPVCGAEAHAWPQHRRPARHRNHAALVGLHGRFDETNPDNSPVVQPLVRMFHMD
jgi:L-rhamnose mutarotase